MGSTKIAGLAFIIAAIFLEPGESRLLCGLEVEYQGFNPIEALQFIQTRQMQEFDKFKESLSQLKFDVVSEDFLAWKHCLSEYEKEKVRFAAAAAKIKLTFLSMVQELKNQKLDSSQYQQELEKLLQQFDTQFKPTVDTFKTNIKTLFETIQDENRRHTWWSTVKSKVSKTVEKVQTTVGNARSSSLDSSTDQESGLLNKIKSVSGNIVAGSENMLSKTASFVASKLENVQNEQEINRNGKYESMNQQVKEGYDSSSQRSVEDESQQQKPAIIQENEFSETSQSGSRSDYGVQTKGSSMSQTKDVGQLGYAKTRSGLQDTNGGLKEINSETTREENVAETSVNQSNYGDTGSETKEVKQEETSSMSQTGAMRTYDETRDFEYGKTRSGLEYANGEISSELNREEKVTKTSENQSNYGKTGSKTKEKSSYKSQTGSMGTYDQNRRFENGKTRSDLEYKNERGKEISSETNREENVDKTRENQSNYGNIGLQNKEVKIDKTSYKSLEYGKTRSGMDDNYGGTKEKSLELNREEKDSKTSERTSNNYEVGLKNKEVKEKETSYFDKTENSNENRQQGYGKTRSDSTYGGMKDKYGAMKDTYGGMKDYKSSDCSACPCDCSKSGTSYKRRRSFLNEIDINGQ